MYKNIEIENRKAYYFINWPVYPMLRGDLFDLAGEHVRMASSLTRGDAAARVNPSRSLPSLSVISMRCLVRVVRRGSSSLKRNIKKNIEWRSASILTHIMLYI